MESNDIGWSWWTHKQLNDIDDPYIIPSNPGYDKVLDYWRGEGSRPSESEAEEAFLQLAEDAKAENCTFHKDVIDAMFRQTTTKKTKPFTNNKIPGLIYATDYDMGRVNHAWYDNDYTNTDFNTTTNHGGEYRNDGVDIEVCRDTVSNGYNVGWIEDNEWLKYTVEVTKSGVYTISFRLASDREEGKLFLEIDGVKKGDIMHVTSTGGLNNWETLDLGTVHLNKSEHAFRIFFDSGGFNLNYIEARLVE
jgi:hypothetical protein